MAKASEAQQLKRTLDTAHLFVEEFSKHVNVDLILKATKEATEIDMREQASRLSPTALRSKRPVPTDPAGRAKTSKDAPNATKKLMVPQPASAIDSKHGSSTSFTRDQIVA